MKGRGAVVAVGLAALVAGGAGASAWLVERTLTDETNRILQAQGVNAQVTYSGRSAKVTVDMADTEWVGDIIAGIPGVSDVSVNASQPTADSTVTPTATLSATASASPSPSSTPSPTQVVETPAPPSETPSPEAEPTPLPEVVLQFGGGSADMLEGQDERIEQITAWLAANPTEVIQVVGHTDGGRTPSFRQKLSKERAQHVADLLVAAGVDPAQLVVVGKADKEPVASNDTREGQAANRRVTFVAQGER
ncbi:OmpA family protein [Arachnia propionica]|nr:OmpA family protein [Arachnia propionica]MDO5084423.1 OmpA family protein [Arachnia propionica]